MQPLTEPRHYHSDKVWEMEQASIFANCWLFAGFKNDIPNDKDWFTVQLGNNSVIVQNCNGRIRAFQNVCSHRGSRICAVRQGSGVLQCPYHGWQYDEQGRPSAIPKKPRFPELDENKQRELSLTSYETGICGNLIFVRKNPQEQTLEEYLGEMYPVLEKISMALGHMIDDQETTVQANWKINVENSLEAYHVGFVHSETFAKTGLKELKFKFCNLHSQVESEYGPKLTASWGGLKSKLQTVYPHDGYSHWFIFPNLLVAGSYGLSFSFSTFSPTAPAISDFRNRLFQIQLAANSTSSQYLLDGMMDSVKMFNRQVFGEDTAICELMQKGVSEAHRPGILSDEEERVCIFQKIYQQQLTMPSAAKLPS